MHLIKYILPCFMLLIAGCKTSNKKPVEEYRTGIVSLKEIKQEKWFKKEYKKYHVSKTTVDSLTNLKEFNIKIIGGEWCSDTRLQLPRFIKITETLKLPPENLQIIFVDRKKNSPNCRDCSIEGYHIKFIPTFIVFDKSGKEMGRIVESPKKTLERDLLKIISPH